MTNITIQEEQALDMISKEKVGISVDEFYRRVYAQRIFDRSWLVKNALQRLEEMGLITIRDNRIYIKIEEEKL